MHEQYLLFCTRRKKRAKSTIEGIDGSVVDVGVVAGVSVRSGAATEMEERGGGVTLGGVSSATTVQ